VLSKRVQRHVSTKTTQKRTFYDDCAIDPAVDLTEKPLPQSKLFPFFLVTFDPSFNRAFSKLPQNLSAKVLNITLVFILTNEDCTLFNLRLLLWKI